MPKELPSTNQISEKSKEEVKEQCKPCCACPETRKARDECTMMAGEDMEVKCADLIKAHQDCMRSMGFNI